MGRASALLLLVMAGSCRPVGPPTSLRDDVHDRSYLATRLKEDGCREANVDECCAEIQTRLQRAIRLGSMQDGAVQLELMALSCRQPDPALLDVFREREVPVDAREIAAARKVSLSYDIHVNADDRIYWAGAYVDGRMPVWDLVAPGPHELEIELHVLPISGVGANQLYRLRKRIPIEVPPDRQVAFSVMLRRTLDTDPDRAFALLLRGAVNEPSVYVPRPGEVVSKGSLITGGALHPPTELYGRSSWAVLAKICVDSSGRVQSVEPLIKTHPRDVGSLVDWIVRRPHDPYRLDGLPVPYCYPLRFEVVGRR